jgi:hypothetical protein
LRPIRAILLYSSSVTEDQAVQDLLAEVAEQWQRGGILDRLGQLVQQVWRADLDRFEPDLGDDLMSLGVQASRNLCNLAVRELSDLPHVIAKNKKTLEISFGGRVLHTGKAPSDSPDWSIDHVDWSESEVRESAAASNTAAYQSSAGTLFEDLEPVSGQRINPAALRHLHLTWQGFTDGGTRTWLGFPQLGIRPWYAVMILDDATSLGAAPGQAIVPGTVARPSFSELNEPDLRMVRRPQSAIVDLRLPGA